jgi:hypothetical protein
MTHEQRAILNFSPGPQGWNLSPSGNVHPLLFTHRGEHSPLFRRMEGRTENFTPGGQSLPLGAKLRMGLWAQADLTIFQMLWRILRHLPLWFLVSGLLTSGHVSQNSTSGHVSQNSAVFRSRPGKCEWWSSWVRCTVRVTRFANYTYLCTYVRCSTYLPR